MTCNYCGGHMSYVGTSNGAETYRCDSCGNQVSYPVSRSKARGEAGR